MVRLFPLLLLAGACGQATAVPRLNEVSPAVMEAGRGGPLELRGEGFLPAGAYDFDVPARSAFTTSVSAWLEQGELRVDLVDVTWLDAQVVQAQVPEGVSEGTWTVHLVTPRNLELSLQDALRLQASLPDAGELDGGLDGGQLDAGEADGGALDGGLLDAGPCQTITFADGDGDGFGAADSGALVCGPNRTLAPGDCNDVDSLTSPAGVEVCNELDDDCDGLIDEGICRDAGFVRVDAGTSDFLSASAWAPERLWVAGGGALLVREGDAGFVDVSTGCPMNMNAVWADPSGRAFVAGGNNGVGRLTTATRAGGCRPSQMLPDPVAGLVGFTSADGGVQVEGVLRDGRRLSWDGLGTAQVFGAQVPSGTVLYDAHGVSPAALYAVGGTTGSPQRPVVFRLQADGTFALETLPAQGLQNGQLHGVWAVSPDEVVAVGDNGLVLRRVGGTWERLAPPSTADYTTVRAFSIGRFYLSTVFGYLRRWNGAWSLRYTDEVPVRDLTAFDEEHFWLAGDNGLVIRGPTFR